MEVQRVPRTRWRRLQQGAEGASATLPQAGALQRPKHRHRGTRLSWGPVIALIAQDCCDCLSNPVACRNSVSGFTNERAYVAAGGEASPFGDSRRARKPDSLSGLTPDSLSGRTPESFSGRRPDSLSGRSPMRDPLLCRRSAGGTTRRVAECAPGRGPRSRDLGARGLPSWRLLAHV